MLSVHHYSKWNWITDMVIGFFFPFLKASVFTHINTVQFGQLAITASSFYPASAKLQEQVAAAPNPFLTPSVKII